MLADVLILLIWWAVVFGPLCIVAAIVEALYLSKG